MPPVEVRATQTILSLDAVGSDRAALWFPELVEIGATGERPVFFDGPSPCPVWKPEGESALGYRFKIPGRLAIGANIQPHPLGFDLSLELTNKSPGDWKQVIAAVCLQLTPAASFLDLTRERTGCVSGGRVRSFAEMKTIGGRPEIPVCLRPGPHSSEAAWGPYSTWSQVEPHGRTPRRRLPVGERRRLQPNALDGMGRQPIPSEQHHPGLRMCPLQSLLWRYAVRKTRPKARPDRYLGRWSGRSPPSFFERIRQVANQSLPCRSALNGTRISGRSRRFGGSFAGHEPALVPDAGWPIDCTSRRNRALHPGTN